MAWIYLHQSIVRNPKTKRLAKRLNIRIAESIGLLSCLWLWAIDYAKDGYLHKFNPWELAEAALWEKDPEKFYQALIDPEIGWVTIKNGKPWLNDWDEYGGKIVEKLEKDAERKRDDRGKKKISTGCPSDVQRMSAHKDRQIDRQIEGVEGVDHASADGPLSPAAPSSSEIPDPDQPPPPEKTSHLSRAKSLLEEMEEWWAALKGRTPPLSPVEIDAIRQSLSTGLPAADIRSLVEKKVVYLRSKGRNIGNFGYFKDQITEEAQRRNLITAPIEAHPLAQVPTAKKKTRLDDLDRYWAQVETGCWDPDAYENGHELQEKHGLDPERREAS